MANYSYYTYLTNHLFTTSKYDLKECLLCREFNANMFYVTITTLIPAFTSWASAYLFAFVTHAYPLPQIDIKTLKDKHLRSKAFVDLKKIFKKTNIGFSPALMRVFCVQFFLVGFVSYFQAKQFYDMEDKFVFDKSDLYNQFVREDFGTTSFTGLLAWFKKKVD
jgi:hypothetical protein